MNRLYRIREPLPNRIAILRALQLGDLLCAVPAIRSLRAALPEATISLIGLSWAKEYVDRFRSYFDDFIEFPGYPGLPERAPDLARIPGFLVEMQQKKFDLILQMQGSGSVTNSLVMLFGAQNAGGFYLPGQYCPDETRFLIYPVNEPEVLRHIRLMEFLGVPPQGVHLEFPLMDDDWDALHTIPAAHKLLPGQYICIHPGSRALDRRWPLGRYANVADKLADQGYQIVLTGTKEESNLARALLAAMKSPAVDLTGKTSLGSLGALLSNARLLICNDTGISHMADALRVPSIVLFTVSDPKRWAPLDKDLHRAITWATAAPPQVVLNEAQELLQKERVYAG